MQPKESSGEDSSAEWLEQFDWFSCNRCLIQPSSIHERCFFVAECGHIFCSACKEGAPGSCPACGQSGPRSMQITSDTKSNKAVGYKFMNLIEMAQTFIQVLEFQTFHQNKLWEHSKLGDFSAAGEQLDELMALDNKELEARIASMEQQLDRLEKLPLEFEAQSLQLKQEHDALVNQLGVRGFHITRTPTQGMENNPGGELIPYLTKDQMPPPKLPGPRAFKVLPSPLGGQEFVPTQQTTCALAGRLANTPIMGQLTTPPWMLTTCNEGMSSGEQVGATTLIATPSQVQHITQLVPGAKVSATVRRQVTPSPQSISATVRRQVTPSPQSISATVRRQVTPSPQSISATVRRQVTPSPRSISATVRQQVTPSPRSITPKQMAVRDSATNGTSPAVAQHKAALEKYVPPSSGRISVRPPPVGGKIGPIPGTVSPNSSILKLLREGGYRIPGPTPSFGLPGASRPKDPYFTPSMESSLPTPPPSFRRGN